jgi:hypothetical protein
MERNFHELNSENPELPDHAGQIGALLETEVSPGIISDEAVQLAAGLLDKTFQEHGDPGSESYKPYHNVQHELNVLRRSWRLWRLLQEELPDKFDDHGYELVMFAACGHDIFVDNESPPGEDERKSGEYTRDYMIEGGYSEEDADIVYEMIEATAVERDETGTIVQFNIRQGSKYLGKLVLATADTNGIPMEGIPTMIDDGFNLWMEFSKTSVRGLLSDPKGAVGFMLTQAKYLEDRLDCMDKDLAYYFTDKEVSIIKEVFENEFTGATRDALGAARMLARFPNLAEVAIETSVKTTEKAAGSSWDALESVKGRLAHLLSRTKPK